MEVLLTLDEIKMRRMRERCVGRDKDASEEIEMRRRQQRCVGNVQQH